MDEARESYACDIPQEIWRKIFCLLPMREAARASTVSRTWRQIWYSFPNLIFHIDDFPDTQNREENFVEFLQGTLDRHDMSNIVKFEIEMPAMECDTPIRNEWIEFAINHNVSDLYLNGKVDPLGFPHGFFNSQSIMKLHLILPEYVLDHGDGFFLPNLKELKLRAITIVEGFNLILEGCPTLRSLWFICCDLNLLNTLTLSSSSLQNLTIGQCQSIETCKLSFDIPKLKELTFLDDVAFDYEFLSNVAPFSGFIAFGNPFPLERPMVDQARSTFNLFKGFHMTEGLEIYPWFMEILSWSPNFLHQIRNVSFERLNLFKLCIWPIKSHVIMLMLILTKLSKIETLDIVMKRTVIGPCCEADESIVAHLSEIKKQPGIFLETLTCVTISVFEGNLHELNLVKFLLESAPNLKTLKIKKDIGDLNYEEISTVIRDIIYGFNRVSSAVEIEFC